jgi:hypothetical protein
VAWAIRLAKSGRFRPAFPAIAIDHRRPKKQPRLASWCYNQILRIFIFISEKEPSVQAFTSDERGENLPVEHAPWSALGDRAPST